MRKWRRGEGDGQTYIRERIFRKMLEEKKRESNVINGRERYKI